MSHPGMPCPSARTPRTARLRSGAGAFGVLLAGALVLTGCGPASSSQPTVAATGAGGSGARGFGGGGRMPGVSGLVAAVDGHTMQVQDSSSQTAVTWTSATRFTDTVAASLADVKPGVCVVARSAAQGARPGATGGGGTGGASSGGSAGASTVAATMVTISAPTRGGCDLGGPGGFGGRGGRAPGGSGATATPGERPSGARTGAPGAGRGFFGGAFGTVVSVSGSTFQVREQARAFAGSSATATAAPRTVTVTVDPTTTWVRTTRSTAASVKVGRCVTALGKADDTGAVTATAVAVRPAVNGSCSFGRGQRDGGSGTGGGASTSGGAAGA
ncbi:DUF5666 domain-containing protein [Oryzihumus sp.]|uniref:DUF5666 domain-containing protein n=1 Tax=Oryzihumus sp. TaxID=1968903 RepID=UPI002ED8B322